MCHPDVPPGWATAAGTPREITVALPGGEALPCLHVGPETAPGVLLIGDVFGRSPFYENLAVLIAQTGLQVVLPDFFFRQGPLAEQTKEAAFGRRAQLDEVQTLDDLHAVIAWLREHGAGERVGTIGFCMGGTFVLDLASTEDDLVSVAYYGFPVPKAKNPPPPPADLVDDLRGPVLAIWGEGDETVGLEQIRDYVERASRANPDFVAEVLEGLGHGFLAASELGNPDDPGAATWPRALAHLNDHLQLQEAR